MTTSKCETCITEKPEPKKYCRCEKCGHYRPLRPNELLKVSKRK